MSKSLKEKIDQSKKLEAGSTQDLNDVVDFYVDLLPRLIFLGSEYQIFKNELTRELYRVQDILFQRMKT